MQFFKVQHETIHLKIRNFSLTRQATYKVLTADNENERLFCV
jgi:hypothetical protein